MCAAGPSSDLIERTFAAARVGDRARWDAGTASEPDFRGQAAMLFDNVSGLALDQLQVRLTGVQRGLPPNRPPGSEPGARTCEAIVSWRLPGERASARGTVWLTLTGTADRTKLAGTDDGAEGSAEESSVPIWWLAPVERIDRPGLTLLLGAGQAGSSWVDLTAASVADARRQLPAPLASHWPNRVVVEIPGRIDDFVAILGSAPGAYADTAAVTRPEGQDVSAALRIVVNPALARQPERERRLTLTHETVHVATRSARSPAPLWAVEGLAEYVAYQAQPAARAPTRQRLGRALQGQRLPAAWPDDAAFATTGPEAETVYAQAWIACAVIARDHSEQALGEFYARLDAGDTVAAAARRALHTDEASLLRAWRAELGRIAAADRTR